MSSAPTKPYEVEAHRRGCITRFGKFVAVIQADLYRYAGNTTFKSFIKHYVFTPGYKYTVQMRLCGYLKTVPARGLGTYFLAKALLLRTRHKFHIAIPEYTLVAPGFFINRFGGIYIGGDAVLYPNINVTHGVLLGYTNRGERAGCPVVGARTFLGAGAKIIGRIHIGNDCSVGANAVVTKDVPDRGVVGGVPAKLLSQGGSDGYINRQVPEALIRRCIGAFAGPVPDDFYGSFTATPPLA